MVRSRRRTTQEEAVTGVGTNPTSQPAVDAENQVPGARPEVLPPPPAGETLADKIDSLASMFGSFLATPAIQATMNQAETLRKGKFVPQDQGEPCQQGAGPSCRPGKRKYADLPWQRARNEAGPAYTRVSRATSDRSRDRESDLRDHLNSRRPDLRDHLRERRSASQLRPAKSVVVESQSAQQHREKAPPVGGSKFVPAIRDARFRERYKPPTLPEFDGKSDPDIHLSSFNLVMDITRTTEAQKCHLLAMTLKGRAHQWFHRLGPGTIKSFGSFSRMLRTQFCSSQSRVKTTTSLKLIVRRDGEPVKSYLKRFDDEAQEINGLVSDQAAAFFCEGVRNPNLVAMLRVMAKGDYHKVVGLVAEFAEAFDAAEKEMQGPESSKGGTQRPMEEAQESERPREASLFDTRGQLQPRAKGGFAQGKVDGSRTRSYTFPRYEKHTPLAVSVAEVIASLEPGKIEKSRNFSEQRRFGQQRCAVHGYVNHSSEDCRTLRDQIEHLFREGQIDRFIDFEALAKERGKEAPRARLEPPRNVINVLGHRVAPGKEVQAGDAKRSKGECDPLLVTLRIAESDVRRMLVDSGSAVNVLYTGAFNQMGVRPSDVSPPEGVVVGFNGEMVLPRGTIRLPLVAGSESDFVSFGADFYIIDGDMAYNGIIGRPILNQIRATCSTYDMILQFPTPGGFGVIHGDLPRSNCHANEVHRSLEQAPESTPTAANSVRAATRDVIFRKDRPDRVTSLGVNLENGLARELETFLQEHCEDFAWAPADMPGISSEVITHKLNIDPAFKPIIQKKRPFAEERRRAIEEEVNKLLEARFIQEVAYPTWLANVVMVKKKNGKWRMCVDYTDLNKACPKDSYPLPRIDQLVDATAGHELLSFMDAYSGYNQIRMNMADREKTAFITDVGTFCYKVMPFGLKNAGATYQRLVDRMFKELIGTTMEVYVDDLVVKSKRACDHPRDLESAFQILRQYRMKLNPSKCTFGVDSGRFLGFFVSRQGIEPNPEKLKAINDLAPPTTKRDIQVLAGKVAALNRFIARSGDRTATFFKSLKGVGAKQTVEWTSECQESLDRLKRYLREPRLLSQPQDDHELYLYLAASTTAASSVLTRLEGAVVKPVYFVSEVYQGAQAHYAKIEQLALALILAARKLRTYFQSYRIVVLTNFPLKQILQKSDASGRLIKWAVELSEFDIEYRPRTAIKAQVLADFIAELTPGVIADAAVDAWELFVDGSSHQSGSGAGVLLRSPTGIEVQQAVHFSFPATNNEAEYEALLAGLRLASQAGIRRLTVKSDSLLVINQGEGHFEARSDSMIRYLKLVHTEMAKFEVKLEHIPRDANLRADALSKLASSVNDEAEKIVYIETLKEKSTCRVLRPIMQLEEGATWMDPIRAYLEHDQLPSDQVEARKVARRAIKYTLVGGDLFRRSYSTPLLKCEGPAVAKRVLEEVHEGSCGIHCGGRMLANKILRAGYYWPTLIKEAVDYVKKCEVCQKNASYPRQPAQPQSSIVSPWPFMIWGMDVLGPFPITTGRRKFLLVAIDYFTRWVEAEPLATVTAAQVQRFVWKRILCCFGVPKAIITDNGPQFSAASFMDFCKERRIENRFTSVSHPQSNGLVEKANHVILQALKKKLENAKQGWADVVPEVLWSYRTTPNVATNEAPYSLVYGLDAILPVELDAPTLRTKLHSEDVNNDAMLVDLDLLEEKREEAALRSAAFKQRVARYHNDRVKARHLHSGDFVLRRMDHQAVQPGANKLSATWEGPYRVLNVNHKGACKLSDADGRVLPRTWNVKSLKRFYF